MNKNLLTIIALAFAVLGTAIFVAGPTLMADEHEAPVVSEETVTPEASATEAAPAEATTEEAAPATEEAPVEAEGDKDGE